MYNRYIPNGSRYTRVEETDGHTEEKRKGTGAAPINGERIRSNGPERDAARIPAAPLRFLTGEGKNAGMAGILNALKLEELDSGDILLMLILLLLFLEGDNIELVITLGLMLLLGLGDEKKESDQKE